MTTPDEVDIIQLGRETESFLASRLGRYLMSRADEELEAAKSALVFATQDEAQDLKLQARVAISFKEWLSTAIDAAHVAESDHENNTY